MSADFDVAVVGGGPAGLAAAAFAARAGCSTVLFDAQPGPPDKACGEGLMPAGVRVLDELGTSGLLSEADCAPLVGIRYVQEDGTFAEGRFPAPGLGIRRTALTLALARCAEGSGAEVRWSTSVSGFRTTSRYVSVDTSRGEVRARLLVAADGVHSRLRRLAGLELASPGTQRLGVRQHFRLEPWSAFVEVHLADGVEAFVTPAGKLRVGLAFLWEKGAVELPVSIEGFLRRFPALAARFEGARPDSLFAGAGPLAGTARGRIGNRFVLVGDSAGSVDAITGEGLSLALGDAKSLGALLPGLLDRGARREDLLPLEREAARRRRRPLLFSRVLLGSARRPWLRRRLVGSLGARPRLFEALIALAVG